MSRDMLDVSSYKREFFLLTVSKYLLISCWGLLLLFSIIVGSLPYDIKHLEVTVFAICHYIYLRNLTDDMTTNSRQTAALTYNLKSVKFIHIKLTPLNLKDLLLL